MKRRRLVLFVLVSISGLSSCFDKDFLFVEHEKTPPGERVLIRGGCQCPEGFTVNPARDGCTRESRVDPTLNPNAYPIVLGDTVGSYASANSYFEDGNASTNWPLALEPWKRGADAGGAVLPGTAEGISPFWLDRVRGLNRVSIKSEKQGVWHTKTVCIDAPEEKVYSFFVGSDNNWLIRIDGSDYARCSGSYCFVDLRFLSQSLKSGKHLVELKYIDEGAYGALWYEIFNQNIESLKTVASERDLNIIFTSKSLVGQKWDYSGEICPPGYSYDICDATKKCTKLEKSECLR